MKSVSIESCGGKHSCLWVEENVYSQKNSFNKNKTHTYNTVFSAARHKDVTAVEV
jgi:hypothetical protein